MVRADTYFVTTPSLGRLAILPRPRGGDWLDDEIASLQQQGIDTLVSLLEDAEIYELNLIEEERSCVRLGMQFVRLPIVDRGVPESFETLRELVQELVAELRQGRGVGIHCRMGVGRSSLLAACVLRELGVSLDDAWRSLAFARRCEVPDTVAQRDWVAAYSRLVDRMKT